MIYLNKPKTLCQAIAFTSLFLFCLKNLKKYSMVNCAKSTAFKTWVNNSFGFFHRDRTEYPNILSQTTLDSESRRLQDYSSPSPVSNRLEELFLCSAWRDDTLPYWVKLYVYSLNRTFLVRYMKGFGLMMK